MSPCLQDAGDAGDDAADMRDALHGLHRSVRDLDHEQRRLGEEVEQERELRRRRGN